MDASDGLSALRPLARLHPSLDAVLGELARLNGELALPRGSIHVISDIHGEDAKLRAVVNNASGTLRPLVKRLFAERMRPDELQQLLGILFYPREALSLLEPALRDPSARQAFCRRMLADLFLVVNVLARRYPEKRAREAFPPDYADLFAELLRAPSNERGPMYYDALIEPLVRHGRALQVIRLTGRVVRNLAIEELVIGGDCWDRGPRGDRVVDYLMKQPRVSFVWGNHDAAWLGAALGCEALVAHVLRISLRYRRTAQLEEGYGIPLEPLAELARSAYGDDPAERFVPKVAGPEPLLHARMQKAAALMQFKLEGQLLARYPEWGLEHRRLLGGLDPEAGTVRIDGKDWPLADRRFPTLDKGDPYSLSLAERDCLEAMKRAFMSSEKLFRQLEWLLRRGCMSLIRDDHLVFHGCVPVDASGEFLSFPIDGVQHRGKGLFDAIERVLARILDDAAAGVPDRPPEVGERDRDLCWYLWCGPLSPLFGKDRIATLENDLVADKAAGHEEKNPYFALIHEAGFCEKVLAEFGADPSRGLIVNGHVPVKIEKGESPLKRSGKAITIDGAFSEAYGDHGYTLVLEPDKTTLATHHHFDSAEAAVREGKDIIPTVSVVRSHDPPRTVGDTERGRELRLRMAQLERLAQAYRENRLR
ncbi:MAG: fructose-1,6-bisphosphatase [Gemmataceae bacterium]|nr:fructose-1,6-bisphosphatase [Gemmataceae bacterium]